ncbi:MAG: ABC transporter ATP-binding protein [Thermodesulfobacteriota bacterium]
MDALVGQKGSSDQGVLRTEGLSKNFGALKAVDRVDLTVESGVHSIIGPNGAGKTTLFNLLTGFLKPDTGKIFYLGKDITNLQPYEISQLGMARSFQITSIFPELTVFENVRLAVQSRLKAAYNFLVSFKSLNGVEERTEKVLKDVGLYGESDIIAKNLSYGLQRCLDIGISLATEPKLILLDEPTSGLSQEDANRIIHLISEIAKNIPVLVIEHNIDIVLSISDIITVLYQGGVLAEGSASEITNNQKVQEAYLGGI